MRLSRWVFLIGTVVGLGCLQVAQRTAAFMRGYALGDRLERLQAQQTDVSRLRVEVVRLSSPVQLADVAETRRLKLVAWSRMDGAPVPARSPNDAHPEPALTAVASMTDD